MITFTDLSSTNNDEILDCFNDSFSDYAVSVQLNARQFESKLHTEDINKKLSIGAFKEGRLVGIVLHGDRMLKGRRVLYNAGTGVRPSERGQKLTRRMYAFILPTLKSEQISKVELEVIADNIPAIKSYEAIGFRKRREVICFKGEIGTHAINDQIKIAEVDNMDLEAVGNFCDVKPTWQNTFETIKKLESAAKILLAYHQDEIVGFCIMNSSKNHLMQLAVKNHMRRQHVATSLIEYVKHNISPTILVINVDSRAEAALNFLHRSNLRPILTQWQMECDLAAL